jgi:hypothetical protein
MRGGACFSIFFLGFGVVLCVCVCVGGGALFQEEGSNFIGGFFLH